MATKMQCGRGKIKTEIWQVPLDGKNYPIQVSYKKMKTVRLRVVAGGQIRLSAPHRTSREWLEQFLREREQWILINVEKMGRVSEIDGNGLNRASSSEPLTMDERKEALAYLIPLVENWYPVVATYGVAMPHVTVRRMRTRYGSCSVGRGRITLASILLQVPRECAEYVVLHELVHFLYPNHGKEFYQFIEKHMPDYRQREKSLRQASRSVT